MTEISFARLSEVKLRDAWSREDRDFTPWLADNIEHLSDAIGIPMELTGTEVAVDRFSADILARNQMDETLVLIENQLETTDHTHLGQIMTYLAGLDAHTVVWIAPNFREPHLSAVHWLNENTAEGFSFFAVKLRVVRIGDSPVAPIFEIAAQPDGWTRSLAEKRKVAEGKQDPSSDLRMEFWKTYAEQNPDAAQNGVLPKRGWNAYFSLADGAVRVSIWIGEQQGGIYVGGRHGDKLSALERLSEKGPDLAKALGSQWYGDNAQGHVLGDRIELTYKDPSNWPGLIRWMEQKRKAYIAALGEVLGGTEA